MIEVGDTVALKSFYGRRGVVSSLTEDTVWVCLSVGRDYKIYPFDFEGVELVALGETQPQQEDR